MMDKPNVHQRLAAVMGEVTYIQKERKHGMQYTVVSHDAVTAKVRPALLKAGIVYYPVRCEHTHNGNRAECSMTVRFVNIDQPSDFFDVPTFGYGIDAQDKGPGKAMSYAVKYALLKALGLETGDDPDTDAQTPNHKPPPAPADVFKAATDRMNKAADMEALRAVWASLTESQAWKGAPEKWQQKASACFDRNLGRLTPSTDMIPGAFQET